MEDFLRFFDSKVSSGYYMRLEIGYNKVAGYCIRVYHKGMGPDGEDQNLAYVQDSDIELAFAKAHVQLKKWLRDSQ